MFKTDVPVVEIKYFAPAVQLATSVNITAPPAVRAAPRPTQCTRPAAAFRNSRRGRMRARPAALGPVFAWCPPPLTKINTVTNFPATRRARPPTRTSRRTQLQRHGHRLRRHDEPWSPTSSRASAAWPSASARSCAFNTFGGGESLPTGARLCGPPSHHAAVRRYLQHVREIDEVHRPEAREPERGQVGDDAGDFRPHDDVAGRVMSTTGASRGRR